MRNERLTARNPKNGMVYLVKVEEHEVGCKHKNILACILEAFNALADFEDNQKEIQDVMEKQTAKKVLINKEMKWYTCPCCNRIITGGNYCRGCGQKLDWEE